MFLLPPFLTFQGSSNSLNKERRETLRKKIVSLTLKRKSKITKVGVVFVFFFFFFLCHVHGGSL